ncbi:MAG TPA: hypothetical protein VIM31_00590 [Candidatus Microsaccharimonas sp.]
MIILISFVLLPLFIIGRAVKRKVANLVERRQVKITYKVGVSRVRRHRPVSRSYYAQYNRYNAGIGMSPMMFYIIVIYLVVIVSVYSSHH